MFMQGFADSRKDATADAVLTGFYVGYYVNGGKKAKSPEELLKRLYAEKQSREDGLRAIEKVKKLENQGR